MLVNVVSAQLYRALSIQRDLNCRKIFVHGARSGVATGELGGPINLVIIPTYTTRPLSKSMRISGPCSPEEAISFEVARLSQ